MRQNSFSYRSPHNGRVFFDDVGWPWPKHGCFVSESVNDDKIAPGPTGSFKFYLKDKKGNTFAAWLIDGEPTPNADGFTFKLKSTTEKEFLTAFISHSELEIHSFEAIDLVSTPAFMLSKHVLKPGSAEVSFLNPRLSAVIACTVLILS